MNASVDISVQQVKLLINGEWVESKTTHWQDIVNPATQEVLAKVPFATADEVNAAIDAAHRAFQTWNLADVQHPLGVQRHADGRRGLSGKRWL